MFTAGTTIGPYRLISRIGKGAFGVVWLAEKQTTIATTKVAIKIPTDETIDLEAVRREASVWVSASGHPNVLPIIDADVYDDQVIIVSEYAPDGSLADWLSSHGGSAPSSDDAVEIMVGILAGLEHLHKRGIIHRDLKPENILLQGETPRLADFGIARVLKTTSHSAATSGTPLYMPPEAFDGKRSEHSDIWSSGVILYQLLTGQLPFDGDDVTTIIGAIIARQPAVIPDCPPHIWSVIEKSLAKKPDERFASAREMRRSLRPSGASSLESEVRPTRSLEKDMSFAPTLKAPGLGTQAAVDKTQRITDLESPLSKSHATKILRHPSWKVAGIAALILISAIGGVLYFALRTNPGNRHTDAEINAVLRRKTDAWIERIFAVQSAKGGIHEVGTSDDGQVWTTAQCLTAALASGKDMTTHIPRIKNAFGFIEATRRSGDAAGWNYYGNSNPFTITEIAGWVVVAETLSLDSPVPVWDEAGRQETLKRILRDLDEIILRQDKNGGWRPIKEDQPGFMRTYATVVALWSLIEARRSPTVSPAIGTRYDESISRGINWLLLMHKTGQGWTPNPNRVGQTARYDGLTAQTLFVLSRAETVEPFSYLKYDRVLSNAKKEFAADRALASRRADKDNSSIPDIDVRFASSEFMAEGSTFLWFPWTLAELSQLAHDTSLSDADRTSAANLRSEILNTNFDQLDTYVETANLMYVFAENLYCGTIYLNGADPH